jgi:hypothetical protein
VLEIQNLEALDTELPQSTCGSKPGNPSSGDDYVGLHFTHGFWETYSLA